MKALCVILNLLWAAGLMSCSSITIKSDFDPEANFAQYKTFDFMPHHTKPGGNPFNDKRIEAALEKQLVAKGYQKQESGGPDLCKTKSVKQIRIYNNKENP